MTEIKSGVITNENVHLLSKVFGEKQCIVVILGVAFYMKGIIATDKKAEKEETITECISIMMQFMMVLPVETRKELSKLISSQGISIDLVECNCDKCKTPEQAKAAHSPESRLH